MAAPNACSSRHCGRQQELCCSSPTGAPPLLFPVFSPASSDQTVRQVSKRLQNTDKLSHLLVMQRRRPKSCTNAWSLRITVDSGCCKIPGLQLTVVQDWSEQNVALLLWAKAPCGVRARLKNAASLTASMTRRRGYIGTVAHSHEVALCMCRSLGEEEISALFLLYPIHVIWLK